MGTGIVSILLHNLPYNSKGLYWVSVVIFIVNVALFFFFFLLPLSVIISTWTLDQHSQPPCGLALRRRVLQWAYRPLSS